MKTGPAAAESIELSVVVPVFNEAEILEELVHRCLRAAGEAVASCELILVDDASTDETPRVLAALAPDGRLRVVRLAQNQGQFRATQHGLREARGALVAVLDGDLQDPPEEIPRLVAALRASPEGVTAACAVKAAREDPAWFRLGAALFHLLQAGLGRGRVPVGAGSFCVMRRVAVARVTELPVSRANLASALAAVGVVAVGSPYRKRSRYDGRSRVGFAGLVREAIGSLALTGALRRLLMVVAALAAVVALYCGHGLSGPWG